MSRAHRPALHCRRGCALDHRQHLSPAALASHRTRARHLRSGDAGRSGPGDRLRGPDRAGRVAGVADRPVRADGGRSVRYGHAAGRLVPDRLARPQAPQRVAGDLANRSDREGRGALPREDQRRLVRNGRVARSMHFRVEHTS